MKAEEYLEEYTPPAMGDEPEMIHVDHAREAMRMAVEEYKREHVNTPEVEDFILGLKKESIHQTERWGKEEEERKYPHDYALVLDKLKYKQAQAIWDGDTDKYKHHLITMAAICHNMHRQIDKEGTSINKYFNPQT